MLMGNRFLGIKIHQRLCREIFFSYFQIAIEGAFNNGVNFGSNDGEVVGGGRQGDTSAYSLML